MTLVVTNWNRKNLEYNWIKSISCFSGKIFQNHKFYDTRVMDKTKTNYIMHSDFKCIIFLSRDELSKIVARRWWIYSVDNRLKSAEEKTNKELLLLQEEWETTTKQIQLVMYLINSKALFMRFSSITEQVWKNKLEKKIKKNA